ncbi:hypothetical protein GSI_04119 [Ganoderma sinense ZZ0214-1]|uniref:Uncharacterized protein n=1 Tax=Ganoderma sinense ZZ0214-1 TaxID=1077348 RepID=A0A2G8SIA2_9APHY|nr:hypothetical protein GSI_04119 [Ganoderma sinense ZZ0214-1]
MVAEAVTTDVVSESVIKYTEDLEAKSAVLSESFQRRQNPRMPTIYAKSKEILQARGIRASSLSAHSRKKLWQRRSS